MMTIFKFWKSYRSVAVSPDAGTVQVQETEKAFYAGALAILKILRDISEEGFPEEEAQLVLSRLQEEGIEFVERLKKSVPSPVSDSYL